MNTEKWKHKAFEWIFQIFKRRSLDDFHEYLINWNLWWEKNCSSTLRLSWPTYGRRGIHAQKNSDCWCGVFNSDRNQIKSKSLHKRKLLLKLWIPQKYIGGLRIGFKVYIAECVALICVSPHKNWVRFTQNSVLTVHNLLLSDFFMNMSTA